VLQSAVANAKQAATRQDGAVDEDRLRVQYAVVNEGPTYKRFTSAAMGRATPMKKRTSHVEIRVGAEAPPTRRASAPPQAGAAKAPRKRKAAAPKAKRTTKAGAKKKKTATRRRSG
jgi:large subunit ribosomal protein L22